MVSTNVYEWKIEAVDAHGDIGEIDHFETYVEAIAAAQRRPGRVDIVLVLHSYGPGEALIDRQHAYLSAKGALPLTFEYGAPVPKRFREEVRAEADRLAEIRAAAEEAARVVAAEEAARKEEARLAHAAKLAEQKAARLARQIAAEVEAARVAGLRTEERQEESNRAAAAKSARAAKARAARKDAQ